MRFPWVFTVALLALARTAAADDTADCIAASESAQTLRDSRALIEARDQLLLCSRDACPGPVKADCIEQRTQVEAALPSIVLRARDPHGQDTSEVKAFADGVLLATQLDGHAVPIDPGPHTLRFEFAGAPPIEQKIVVSEGEKDRLVTVEAAPPPPEVSGAALANTAAKPRAAVLSIPGLAIAGVGVAATIPMAIFWLSGTSDIHQMRTSCAPPAGPGCPADRVDSDHTKLIVGDVLLGVAVAGIATGAVLQIMQTLGARRDNASVAAVRIDASPWPGGALVSARTRF